jgi:hypothetical protein
MHTYFIYGTGTTTRKSTKIVPCTIETLYEHNTILSFDGPITNQKQIDEIVKKIKEQEGCDTFFIKNISVL